MDPVVRTRIPVETTPADELVHHVHSFSHLSDHSDLFDAYYIESHEDRCGTGKESLQRFLLDDDLCDHSRLVGHRFLDDSAADLAIQAI